MAARRLAPSRLSNKGYKYLPPPILFPLFFIRFLGRFLRFHSTRSSWRPIASDISCRWCVGEGKEPWGAWEECAPRRALMEGRTSGVPQKPLQIISWWWFMEFLGGMVYLGLGWSWCIIRDLSEVWRKFEWFFFFFFNAFCHRWLLCLFVSARQDFRCDWLLNPKSWI